MLSARPTLADAEKFRGQAAIDRHWLFIVLHPGTIERRASPERWQSGRMHRTRNAAYGQPYRGFESLPLRQMVFRYRSLVFAAIRLNIESH